MVVLKALLGIVIFAIVILFLCGWVKLFEIIKENIVHTKLYIRWKRSKMRKICIDKFFILWLLVVLVWIIWFGYLIGGSIIK